MTKKNNRSFEKSIQRLDEIVQLLESDDVPLEKIVIYYKEGVEISNYCKKILSDTEKNMKIITEKMNNN